MHDPVIELNGQTLALLDTLKNYKADQSFIETHFNVEIENGKALAEHLPPFQFQLKERTWGTKSLFLQIRIFPALPGRRCFFSGSECRGDFKSVNERF